MVTVDDYARVRVAHRDGMGLNELARTFHHSKRKISAILAQTEPPAYPPRPSPASVLDPFKPTIDAILQADESAPRKQRYTASKIFRRLRDEHGYRGGSERVRLYIRSQQHRHAETFIPLDHDPGQRLEADFGFIYVDFLAGRQQVSVLLTTWAYSNCPFAIALPTQRTEAILRGQVEAFTFYGCCPREVWWDNPTTVVTHILKGRERRLQERYAALASHFCFEPLFCLVRRPQEKPRVEGRVKFLQRDWATPVPVVTFTCGSVACAIASGPRAGKTKASGNAFNATRRRPWLCHRVPSMPACGNPPRWTSIRRCTSITTVTACRASSRSAP